MATIEDGPNRPPCTEFFKREAQAYRIVFTRALKSVYVWIPDRDTSEHGLSSLGQVRYRPTCLYHGGGVTAIVKAAFIKAIGRKNCCNARRTPAP